MPDIALASKTFDLDGFILIDLTGDKEALVERSRIRTIVRFALDGSPITQDGGYTDNGRKWNVLLRPTRDELETLKHLIETYAELNCSTREGFFSVAPQRLSTPSPLVFQFSLTVISKDA